MFHLQEVRHAWTTPSVRYPFALLKRQGTPQALWRVLARLRDMLVVPMHSRGSRNR